MREFMAIAAVSCVSACTDTTTAPPLDRRPIPPPITATPVPPHAPISTCPSDLAAWSTALQSDSRLAAPRLIVVFKRLYRIGLYAEGRLVDDPGCMPISMGDWPYEPKIRRDNMSTPEGWYAVAGKRTNRPDDPWRSRFELALHVDYPRPRDVRAALEQGVIDERTSRQIARSRAEGLPSQRTAMGGQILIHSWYTDVRAATLGCVGVDDENMQSVFARSSVGDPIYLAPWRDVWYQDGDIIHDPVIPDFPPPTIDIDIEVLRKEYGRPGGGIELPAITVRASDL